MKRVPVNSFVIQTDAWVSKTKLITFTGSVAVVRRAVAGPRVAGTKNIGSDDICGGARRLLRIEVADVVKTFIESARSS